MRKVSIPSPQLAKEVLTTFVSIFPCPAFFSYFRDKTTKQTSAATREPVGTWQEPKTTIAKTPRNCLTQKGGMGKRQRPGEKRGGARGEEQNGPPHHQQAGAPALVPVFYCEAPARDPGSPHRMPTPPSPLAFPSFQESKRRGRGVLSPPAIFLYPLNTAPTTSGSKH